MPIRRLAAAAAFAAVAALAQPAAADDPFVQGVITFKGVVSEGDYVSLRDGALTRGSLVGTPFQLRTILRYPDPSIRVVSSPGAYNSTYAEYEPLDARNNPEFYSILTLDGTDYAIGDSYEYVYREQDAGAPNGFLATLTYTDQSDVHFPIVHYRVEAEVLSFANAFLYGIDQLYNIDYTPQPREADGDFRLYYATPSFGRAYLLEGAFDIQSLTITGGQDIPQPPVATVPEPAAWALIIAGFGLAGAALRRRRRLAAVGI